MPFLEGMLTGLAMVAFVGPVFFTLLQISLVHGFRSGFFVALGIFVSDILAASLCYFGAAKFKAFIEMEETSMWIGLLATFILFSIGITYIFKPNVNPNVRLQQGGRTYFGYFTKGFLVNFVNPFVFVVWLAITGYAHDHSGWNGVDHFIYLAVALIMIVFTDSLKALLAQRISKWIRPNILKVVFRIIGVVMVGFGIRTLVYVIGLFNG